MALEAELLAEPIKTQYMTTFKALKELYDQITNTSKLFNLSSEKIQQASYEYLLANKK